MFQLNDFPQQFRVSIGLILIFPAGCFHVAPRDGCVCCLVICVLKGGCPLFKIRLQSVDLFDHGCRERQQNLPDHPVAGRGKECFVARSQNFAFIPRNVVFVSFPVRGDEFVLQISLHFLLGHGHIRTVQLKNTAVSHVHQRFLINDVKRVSLL